MEDTYCQYPWKFESPSEFRHVVFVKNDSYDPKCVLSLFVDSSRMKVFLLLVPYLIQLQFLDFI